MEDCMADDILTKMLQCMKWWMMDEIFEEGKSHNGWKVMEYTSTYFSFKWKKSNEQKITKKVA
jgi:hypothetical protein